MTQGCGRVRLGDCAKLQRDVAADLGIDCCYVCHATSGSLTAVQMPSRFAEDFNPSDWATASVNPKLLGDRMPEVETLRLCCSTLCKIHTAQRQLLAAAGRTELMSGRKDGK